MSAGKELRLPPSSLFISPCSSAVGPALRLLLTLLAQSRYPLVCKQEKEQKRTLIELFIHALVDDHMDPSLAACSHAIVHFVVFLPLFRFLLVATDRLFSTNFFPPKVTLASISLQSVGGHLRYVFFARLLSCTHFGLGAMRFMAWVSVSRADCLSISPIFLSLRRNQESLAPVNPYPVLFISTRPRSPLHHDVLETTYILYLFRLNCKNRFLYWCSSHIHYIVHTVLFLFPF